LVTLHQTEIYIGEGGYCGGDDKQTFKSYGAYNAVPNVVQGKPELIRNF